MPRTAQSARPCENVHVWRFCGKCILVPRTTLRKADKSRSFRLKTVPASNGPTQSIKASTRITRGPVKAVPTANFGESLRPQSSNGSDGEASSPCSRLPAAAAHVAGSGTVSFSVYSELPLALSWGGCLDGDMVGSFGNSRTSGGYNLMRPSDKINLSMTFRHPAAAEDRLPSPGPRPEKVLTVSCRPDCFSKEALRRARRRAFSFRGRELRRRASSSKHRFEDLTLDREVGGKPFFSRACESSKVRIADSLRSRLTNAAATVECCDYVCST